MRALQTTTEKRLDHTVLPMRLYHKAKKLGVWDPRDIDFSQDQVDWLTLSEEEQGSILRLCALFQAGEEAVTRDLLPLIRAISMEGRLEEEMFLTTFLFEEAKHTEIFRRFLDEVVGETGDLSLYLGANYQKIFFEELPNSMERLIQDQSPVAQAEASVTYNMVVEGVLAETGYYGFFNALERQNKLPGLLQAIDYLKRDESRHIGYGTYLLSRLICENDELWEVIQQRIQYLMPYAMGVVKDLFDMSVQEGLDHIPFGFDPNEFLSYAMKQFQTRMDVLSRSRGKSVDEIYQVQESAVGVI